MARSKIDRRKFLAGVALAGAASASPEGAKATTPPIVEKAPRPSALRPSAAVAAAETGTPQISAKPAGMPGSDFMVDVIKSLDIPYLPSNPAQSFRGLHESLIDYGGNKKPEFLTCTHEETSVAMAHGYFKIAGSHCSYCATVLSASSMQLWRSTMPGVTAFPSSSWAAPISTLPSVRQACRLFTLHRMSVRSSAISPNGTTSRCRCNISPSRSCVPTSLR